MFKSHNNTEKPANFINEYKLFIGCIPGTANDQDILSVLMQFGNITSLILERRKNGKCSGYGYATVSTHNMYEKLLQATPLYRDRQLSVLPFYDKSDLLKSQIAFNKRRIVVA